MSPMSKRSPKPPSSKGDAPSPPVVPEGEIVFYQAPDGSVALDVRLVRETLWLNLNQMAALFERDKSVISRHLRNIFREGELDRQATVASFATVQQEGGRQVERQVEFYNLDAIISVGYRVNSRRGTQFRIWATKVLRDHILKGYSVNERRLKELQKTIRLVAEVAQRRALSGDEATALLQVVNEYATALDLLDRYDQRQLPEPAHLQAGGIPILLDEARRVVGQLRQRFGSSDLFGREVGHGLESALASVFQSVGRQDAYPSIEEKAAHLLYFLVKNHPFADGNKRIASALFLWFLEKNGALYLPGGERRIQPETLVALTLLVAESDPKDMAIMIRLITLLLARRSGVEP